MVLRRVTYTLFLFLIVFSCKKAIYKNYPQMAQLTFYNNYYGVEQHDSHSWGTKINSLSDLTDELEDSINEYIGEFCKGNFRKNLELLSIRVISDSTSYGDSWIDDVKQDTFYYDRPFNSFLEILETDSNLIVELYYKTSYEEKGVAPFGFNFAMTIDGRLQTYSSFNKFSFLSMDSMIVPIFRVHEEIEKRRMNPDRVRIVLSYNERENTLFWYVSRASKKKLFEVQNCFPQDHKAYFKMDALYGDVTDYSELTKENYKDDY